MMVYSMSLSVRGGLGIQNLEGVTAGWNWMEAETRKRDERFVTTMGGLIALKLISKFANSWFFSGEAL